MKRRDLMSVRLLKLLSVAAGRQPAAVNSASAQTAAGVALQAINQSGNIIISA